MAAADAPRAAARARARRTLARTVRRLRHGRPVLTVVVPTAGGDPGRLRATVDSVRDQRSPAIEILLVAHDGDADLARDAAGDDTRARVIVAGSAAQAPAAGVRAARGGHVLLAGPGDTYRPGALAEAVPTLTAGTTYLLADGLAAPGPTTLARTPHAAADPRWGRLLVPTARLRAALGDDEVVAVLGLLREGFEPARAASAYRGVEERTGPFVVRRNPLADLPDLVARHLAGLDALADLPAARAELAAGAVVSLRPALAHAEVATPAEWDTLVSHCAELAEAASGRLDRVPTPVRVAALLAAGGHRDPLVRLVSREHPDALPTTVEDGVVRADLGVPEGLVDDAAFVLGPAETPLETQVHRLLVDGPVVRLEVLAAVRHVDSVAPQVGATTIGAEPRTLVVSVRPDAAVDRWADQRGHDQRTGLVTVEVLHRDLPIGATAVELTWSDRGVTAVAPLRGRTTHGAAGRLPVPLGDGRAVELRERAGVTTLVVTDEAPRPDPTLTRVAVQDGRLHLTTTARVDDVRLVGGGTTVVAEPGSAGFWSVPLRAPRRWTGEEAPLPPGGYRIELSAGGSAVPVVAAGPVVDLTPATWLTPEHRVQLHRAGDDAVTLRLDPALTDDELGGPAQRRLQAEFRASDVPLDPRLVYFQSFTGQWANDNPAAIQAELRRRRPDLDLRWVVADASATVPDGCTPVLFRSRAWYESMTRATYLVTNIELEKWFARRPGQQVLQTFHGYPSKAMGLGLWRPRGLTPAQVEAQLDHTSRVWNTLVTPDPAMDRYYRRDYAYDGTILSVGYPRNDVLVGEAAERLRREARQRLGIADGQRAVLYAPTWRDDLATGFRSAPAVHHLDVARAASALGDDYVLLLRGHRFHAPGTDGSRVVDVTTYPDVNHLIAASDAAVLDYSSLRFDYALTGRPMVFLVPDLESYGSSTRGFLWDYRETAPGPLLATGDEVVAALRDLDGLAARYAGDLAAFNRRYNSLHDGHAAERVVDAFFAPLLEA